MEWGRRRERERAEAGEKRGSPGPGMWTKECKGNWGGGGIKWEELSTGSTAGEEKNKKK